VWSEEFLLSLNLFYLFPSYLFGNDLGVDTQRKTMRTRSPALTWEGSLTSDRYVSGFPLL